MVRISDERTRTPTDNKSFATWEGKPWTTSCRACISSSPVLSWRSTVAEITCAASGSMLSCCAASVLLAFAILQRLSRRAMAAVSLGKFWLSSLVEEGVWIEKVLGVYMGYESLYHYIQRLKSTWSWSLNSFTFFLRPILLNNTLKKNNNNNYTFNPKSLPHISK